MCKVIRNWYQRYTEEYGNILFSKIDWKVRVCAHSVYQAFFFPSLSDRTPGYEAKQPYNIMSCTYCNSCYWCLSLRGGTVSSTSNRSSQSCPENFTGSLMITLGFLNKIVIFTRGGYMFLLCLSCISAKLLDQKSTSEGLICKMTYNNNNIIIIVIIVLQGGRQDN